MRVTTGFSDISTAPAVLTPLLRVPPFPGSKPANLTHTSHSAEALNDSAVDRLIDRIVELNVGGSYWAAQPRLPATPYVLRVGRKAVREDGAAPTMDGEVIFSLPASAGDYGRPDACDPWHLVSGAREVIVDADDELALIAAMAGLTVRCVGHGRFSALQGGGRSAVRNAVRAAVLGGFSYIDPFTGDDIDVMEAVELSGFWRRLIDSNRDLSAAIGFAFWKRSTVAPLLWGGSPVPFGSSSRSLKHKERIAIWKSRTPGSTLARLEKGAAKLIEVEDGFIRSAGLGADCVPPLSIVVDKLGIYFDPKRPSELERLLQVGDFTSDILDRARRLRELIVKLGITKYDAGVTQLHRKAGGRRHLLVPGQVEDDRSVLCGGGSVSTNLELLRRVRESNPGAYVTYKPHPDVEAGHRKGAIPDEVAVTLAQDIVRTSSISSLIDLVDEVHVNTSLAGFEALLRGRPVTTYGVPFYAGWGLTTDLGRVPERRAARRSLDELVAAALLIHPRYLDPVTGLPCPPEVLIRRLSDGVTGPKGGPVVRLRRWQGRLNRAASRIWSR